MALYLNFENLTKNQIKFGCNRFWSRDLFCDSAINACFILAFYIDLECSKWNWCFKMILSDLYKLVKVFKVMACWRGL
jgi:hypothetical protein